MLHNKAASKQAADAGVAGRLLVCQQRRVSIATDETIGFFEAHGTWLEEGRDARQAALDAHNRKDPQLR